MLEALLDAIGSLIDDAVLACLQADLSWPERLSALSLVFVALAAEHRDFFRVHVSALYGVNRAIGAPMTRWLSTSVKRLAEAFRQAMEQGAVLEMPPETLAILVLGSLESLALLPDLLADSSTAGDRHAGTLAMLLWRGMMPLFPTE